MREKKTRGGLFRDEAQHRCTPFDHAGGREISYRPTVERSARGGRGCDAAHAETGECECRQRACICEGREERRNVVNVFVKFEEYIVILWPEDDIHCRVIINVKGEARSASR